MSIPVLKMQRLVLRPFDIADAPAVQRLAGRQYALIRGRFEDVAMYAVLREDARHWTESKPTR